MRLKNRYKGVRKFVCRLQVDCSKNAPLALRCTLIKNKPIQKAIKRAFDIFASLSALIVLSPLFLILVLLIRLTSKGPAFYTQERIGLNGKPFKMFKFRSMITDADKNFEKIKELNQTNEIMFKSKDDPRITPVGKFIRKFSLDELPQLINVLIGNMSLVGPRPPIAREVQLYRKWHHVKFFAKPGITGLWQVSGRSKIKNFNLVIGLDYKYIKCWNLLMDLKIIFLTIPAILSTKGAD